LSLEKKRSSALPCSKSPAFSLNILATFARFAAILRQHFHRIDSTLDLKTQKIPDLYVKILLLSVLYSLHKAIIFQHYELIIAPELSRFDQYSNNASLIGLKENGAFFSPFNTQNGFEKGGFDSSPSLKSASESIAFSQQIKQKYSFCPRSKSLSDTAIIEE